MDIGKSKIGDRRWRQGEKDGSMVHFWRNNYQLGGESFVRCLGGRVVPAEGREADALFYDEMDWGGRSLGGGVQRKGFR